MRWEAVVLISLIAVSTCLNVAMVGKPRKPLEPSAAAFIVVCNGALICLLVRLGAR